eukprot:1340594-Pyramimonas_sp.AAC.1
MAPKGPQVGLAIAWPSEYPLGPFWWASGRVGRCGVHMGASWSVLGALALRGFEGPLGGSWAPRWGEERRDLTALPRSGRSAPRALGGPR